MALLLRRRTNSSGAAGDAKARGALREYAAHLPSDRIDRHLLDPNFVILGGGIAQETKFF